MSAMERIENAAITVKANIYFGGKVVSHAVERSDGARLTVGIIYPGSYNFNTGAPERMDIVAGSCSVRLAGSGDWKTYAAGSAFEVPGNSSFDIAVTDGIAEYVCSYL